MSGRRVIGLVLILAGALLLGYGVSRLLTAGGTSVASPTPAVSATSSAAASAESPSVAPSEAVPTATPVPPLGEADVRAFVEVLVAAIQAGDVEAKVSYLHPATIDRYGEAACNARLAGANPSFELEILDVQPQAAWDYFTDGLTTTIPDAWAAPGNQTENGATVPFTFHFAPWDGTVRWFTDCGDPI